jgi:hypothetical protein
MSQLRPRQARSKFRDADDPPHPEHKADVTMRFHLWWKHTGEADGTAIKETYDKITDDPTKWSRDIIDWFNSTRRPGERERVFMRCEVEGEVPTAEHKWVKATAMTQSDNRIRGGSPYDKMQCERCGITGKRYGLHSHVRIDAKFKLKVYQRCDTSCAKTGRGLPNAAR